ncbi:MAG: hypothetical protein STSR0008_04150 [Ignavibacterium sp.]
MKKFLLLLILLSFVFNSCSTSKRITDSSQNKNRNNINIINSSSIDQRNINVLLDSDILNYNFIISNTTLLKSNGKEIAQIKKGNKVNISFNKQRIVLVIRNKEFFENEFSFQPLEDNLIKYNNKFYKGEISFRTSQNKIQVINSLRMKDYLYGVLLSEMGNKLTENNFEALKAMAICARTFTINKLNSSSNSFDITNTTNDQVYDGFKEGNSLYRKAIEETENEILFYNSSIAKVFYHSTCGGFTEDFQNVFSNSEYPYLRSIKDGNESYCKISPVFSWEEKFSKENILNLLRRNSLISTGENDISNIYIKNKFPSGRIKNIVIDFSNGKKVEISYKNIRNIFRRKNGSILRSTLFNIEVKRGRFAIEEVIFKGNGWGHGVGLCQWGAIEQSNLGHNYKSILIFYFPGTEVRTLND